MFSTRSRVFTLAFAAVALMAGTATVVAGRVATACTAVYRFACDLVASVPAKFEQPSLKLVMRPIELLQACAYARRLVKRDRPRVTPSWRMCPST